MTYHRDLNRSSLWYVSKLVTLSNNTDASRRPEGRVHGMLGEVMLRPRGGQGGVGHRPRRDVTGHLVERRVGSEAVGGGGGPRRSRSSM